MVGRLAEIMEKLKWDKLDLIKIDVEGFKLRVIKGALDTILAYIPTLFIELNNDQLLKCGHSARSLFKYRNQIFGYQKIIHAESGEIISQDDTFEDCHYAIISER